MAVLESLDNGRLYGYELGTGPVDASEVANPDFTIRVCGPGATGFGDTLVRQVYKTELHNLELLVAPI